MSLRQAENRVRIEGILSEINLKYGSYQKNGRTVDNIGGDIKVLVHQEINGENQDFIIPVYMFAAKYTNAGKPNPAYTSIETVMKEYTSIAACGNEVNADKIRITNGDIRMNEYYNPQGQLVSFPRVNASFVNKATGDFRPEASWSLEFAVSSMDFVTDDEGVEVEPRKLRIKILVPQYGGKLDTMELYATNPRVIDAITSYWEAQKTYSAKGRLNFTTITKQIVEEMVNMIVSQRAYESNSKAVTTSDSMLEILFSEGGIQYMLDKTRPAFHNPIFVFDTDIVHDVIVPFA